ncbi:MAG: response regulator [Roseiflexaceae bacterium]|nr:response regulator [Roseiflexaceae bacterium]
MSPRILVVDDSAMNLKIVAASLAPAGYEIVLAHNGHEALERAAAQQPDLVILDVMMPDLDGYEVCRRLRRTPAFAQRPIMMLTANDTLQERIQGLEAGADDYMSKPFEPAELQARIKALLRRTMPTPVAPLAAQGKVIALFSLRGGIGVSTLAANMAVGLSQLWGSSTALVDLAFASGQSALLLNLPLRKTWSDLVDLPIEEIDSGILDRVLLAHESGVQVLATGSRPEHHEFITGAHVTQVVQQLRERFPYVVLDLPHDFQETSLAALDSADQILLVVAPEIASVCAAAGAIDVFHQLDYPPDKVTLVLNTTIERGGLALKDIEQTLKQTIPLTLPCASELFVRALNRGIPLVTEHATKPLGAILEDWAFLLSTEAQRRERPANPTPAWQRLAQRAQQRRTAR